MSGFDDDFGELVEPSEPIPQEVIEDDTALIQVLT